MLKVTDGNGKAMNGKRLNNFGGKNPQKQSNVFTEPKYQRLQSNRYGAMEVNAAPSPQRQNINSINRLFGQAPSAKSKRAHARYLRGMTSKPALRVR